MVADRRCTCGAVICPPDVASGEAPNTCTPTICKSVERQNQPVPPFPHEKLSLAIGMWMLNLPGTTRITHNERQQLHTAIVGALTPATEPETVPADMLFQAYQIVGYLDSVIFDDTAKPSTEEMIRAMDYLCSETYDENFLPWPKHK